MSIKNGVILTSILLSAVALPAAAAKPKNWRLNVDMGGFYDSNLGKAKLRRDTVEDEVAYVDVNWQYNWQPKMGALFSFRLLGQAQQFDTVESFNNQSYGGEVAFSWQNDYGYLAPFYRVSLTAKRTESDAMGRNSDSLEFQTFATKRLTTAITGRLGYQYNQLEADHEVFDNEEHRVFANFDYIWNQDLISYFTASYLEGNIYSIAQGTFCNGLRADDIYPFIKYAEVIWRDKSFNQHFCGDWFAYRMEAETQTYTLGFNYALSHKYSLDVSATYVDSRVSDSVEYQREIIRAGLLVRF